jgi:YidC/Oxa1 family membrane protein insertase
MNNNENKSFLDPNTIFALIITFVLFFGWQQYLKVKYPESAKKAFVEAEKTKKIKVNEPQKTEENKATSLKPLSPEPVKPTIISVSNKFWSFDLNSVGMQIQNVKINDINKVENEPYKFNYPTSLFPTLYNDDVLNFKINQPAENTVEGTAYVPNGGQIKKTITIDSDSFSLKVKIDLIGFSEGDQFSINHPLRATIEDPKKIIFFLPAFDRNEFYVESSEGKSRRILNTSDISEKESFTGTKLYSLSDHYFSVAYLSEGKLLPKSSFKQNNENLEMNLSYLFSKELKVSNIEYTLFLGPKRLDLLNSFGEPLLNLIDFTFLGFIARPIVKALNVIYAFVGNYGLAVIILTFLIRLLILPLAVSSFKSMKKMQKIQPKLKEIKEKYKDDKQKVNQMTMQIMKDNNVNPMGGCLPLLLQLPIFFAFYRGLSESVDLYQAPFFLWIDDLTKVDPYFVLPILSIAGMVVHQLITPNTMEKAQRRMMLFMPIVFGFFIFTLPSALTLYMVVTTWFGIGQHAIFLRDKPA